MANIKVQLNQSFIEVSGSEEFVKEQYEELIKQTHFYERAEHDGIYSSGHEEENKKSAGLVYAEKDLENFFSTNENGIVNINMPVPGNNKAERIKSLVLLIGYAKRDEWIPFAIIAEECKRQGCWDSKNFASYIKQLGSNVMINGSKRSLRKNVTRKMHESLDAFWGSAHIQHFLLSWRPVILNALLREISMQRTWVWHLESIPVLQV